MKVITLQNILELSKVLTQVFYAKSKTELDIYYENICVQIAHGLPNDLTKHN